MLSMLLVLHLFWTYFIFKVIFKAISTGKLDKDERSSSDETVSDSSSSTVETTTNNHIVGPHGDSKDGGYKNHVKVQWSMLYFLNVVQQWSNKWKFS